MIVEGSKGRSVEAWLIVKAAFFAALLPGMIAAGIPIWLGGGFERWPAVGTAQAAALVPIVIGWIIIAWPVVEFTRHGRATIAPIDAPKVLVMQGLYRYMRNPMYVGAVLANLGWALFFESRSVLIYALSVWLLHFAFVVLYEEPTLRRMFGQQYADYCARVRRWGIA